MNTFSVEQDFNAIHTCVYFIIDTIFFNEIRSIFITHLSLVQMSTCKKKIECVTERWSVICDTIHVT